MLIVTYILAVILFFITILLLAYLYAGIIILFGYKGLQINKTPMLFFEKFISTIIAFRLSLLVFLWLETPYKIMLLASIFSLLFVFLFLSNKIIKSSKDTLFLAHYHKKLNELGIEDSEIDMKTEHLKQDDPRRQQAMQYAQNEVSEIDTNNQLLTRSQLIGILTGILVFVIFF